MANNYTLGKSELHFAKFLTGTQTPGGERYIGNTPEFNATFESESLDHYDSDHGVNEMDFSIVTQLTRSATFTTDNIDPDNLATFFFGSASVFSVVGTSVTDEEVADVVKGLTYQLGMSATNPVGARALDQVTAGSENITVKVGAATKAEGTDYIIDMERGRLTVLASGTIASGSDLLVSYKTKSSTRTRIISGNTPIEGALRSISFNPAGEKMDWYMPWVKLKPNGDFALKSNDALQVIPFSVQILKPSNREAVYVDGEPLVVA